jgi:transposase
MNERTPRFVGIDVHKETITVAVAEADGTPAIDSTIANDPGAVRKLMHRLGRDANLRVAYEAGPTGYALHRQLVDLGIECMVVAPSLVPKRAGDRVKTDGRDALTLVRLLRSGDLVAIRVPTADEEALRDLVRSRMDAQAGVLRAKHHLSKFLLRHGLRGPLGVKAWTVRYQAWLNELTFQQRAAQVVFEDYRAGLRAAEGRLRHLELELQQCAQTSPQVALIAALQALRGLAFLSAVTIVAETGDLRRFATAPQFMAYTGLVPSEHSSGQRRQRGQITHTGNSNLRHILVQAAHNARYAPQIRNAHKRRLEGMPPDLIDLSWRAQQRLHRRYRHISARLGRPKAIVAVARELAGFVWAVGQRMEAATA